ncbi:hypothetical protein COOONC_17410 [Cooperia oncophora]
MSSVLLRTSEETRCTKWRGLEAWKSLVMFQRATEVCTQCDLPPDLDALHPPRYKLFRASNQGYKIREVRISFALVDVNKKRGDHRMRNEI